VHGEGLAALPGILDDGGDVAIVKSFSGSETGDSMAR